MSDAATRIGGDDGFRVATCHHRVAVTVEIDFCIHHKHNCQTEHTFHVTSDRLYKVKHTVFLWCPGLGKVYQLFIPTACVH